MEKFAGYGFNRSHAYAYSALPSSWPISKTTLSMTSFLFKVDVEIRANSDYVTDALEAGFEVAHCPLILFPITIKLPTNLSI